MMNLTESVWSYRVEAGVAVLTIDAPPVNALSHKVRIALSEGVARALADASAGALVIICAGRTFFAGADVSEIGKPIQPPLLGDVMALFEASAKPIVSAMHGTALGGGLELALAGHYRVAVPSAVVGLPEVALGLLPGAGGTQRVPRLIGVAAAIDMIGLGRHVKAPEACALGLIDQLVPEGELEAGAVASRGKSSKATRRCAVCGICRRTSGWTRRGNCSRSFGRSIPPCSSASWRRMASCGRSRRR
jgi:3-hydroxyacyl-CoA dehydrogenase